MLLNLQARQQMDVLDFQLIYRDIDQALRPAIYAIVDTCSADDLPHA